MKSAPLRIRMTTLLTLAVILFGAMFLYAVGIDALEENNEFQFFSDSTTYHKAARGDLSYIEGAGDLMSVAANYLGPVLLVWMTGDNYYALLLFNVCLFYFAVTHIGNSLRLSSYRYALVLLANPLMVSSILSVNKEILSLVFIALLLRAFTARSVGALLGAAFVSVLVRWQLTLLLPIVWLAITRLNPVRKNRALVIFVALLGLSVLYTELFSIFESIRENFWVAAEEYEGSGFYEWLVSLQDMGLYWAVFPLKAAHLLFGTGVRFDRLLSPTNIYNDVWVLLHSTALLIVFILLGLKGRLRLSNDLIYLSLLYIVLFAVTPIYGPRYFLPVYMLWAAALVAKQEVYFLPSRRSSPTSAGASEIPPLRMTSATK